MTGRTLLFGGWGVRAAGACVTAATLQALGPPRGADHPKRVAVPSPVVAASRPEPTRLASGTIAAPDRGMLAPDPDQPGRMLPVVGADGRAPSSVYEAAPVAVLPNQARLALLVDGIGLDEATSRAAIAELPAPVDLAFSPYAEGTEALAAAARARGHEMLVSLPMEPQGSPMDDEGDRQLSQSSDEAANHRNLLWALSSLQGYVGVTGAEAGQAGEHVLGDRTAFAAVARTLRERGLMFVDPRPGAPPAGLSSVAASAVIDADADLMDLEAQLEALASEAQRTGQAVGVTGPLRPVTLARLLAWVRTLPGRGIVLVPASSLAVRPAEQPTTTSPARAAAVQ